MKTKLHFFKTMMLIAALIQGCQDKEVIPEKQETLSEAYVVELPSVSHPDSGLSMLVIKDRRGTAIINTSGNAQDCEAPISLTQSKSNCLRWARRWSICRIVPIHD